jgi:hypothetical protein
MAKQMSSDFDWDLNRQDRAEEWADCKGEPCVLCYELHLARQLIVANPRPVEQIDLEADHRVRQSVEVTRLRPRHEWGDNVDPDFPVIVGREPGPDLRILDGRHRAALALELRRKFLPAVFLTAEETVAIRSVRL